MKKNYAKEEQSALDWLSKSIHLNLHVNLKGNKPVALMPFKLYLFSYNAKFRDTLPYWDVYPLIMMWRPPKKGYFTGINFHYLNYRTRAVLFDSIRNQTSTQAIYSVAKIKPFNFAIKQYLIKRTKGVFYCPNRDEWNKILFLPVAKFISGPGNKRINVQQVWKDSLKKK